MSQTPRCLKHLQSKVKSRIGFLFHNKASFTHSAKHTLVKLTILPILDLYALIVWPSLHICRQTHWLQAKSLLGKALPYFSSLVTIAAPIRSMCSSRYISLVNPKANSSFGRLSFQFSAANDWNDLQKSYISPSLTLSTSYQNSSQITAPDIAHL